MEKLRVLSIFGTRPEATKMVPPIKAMEANKHIESVVCITAQHRQILDDVMEAFDIKPDYDLNLMKEGQSLTELTARAIEGLGKVIAEAKPDYILVHGDTATTLAGALAAFYSKVKVAHVEAGLRTYDKYQPFPEEINRKVTAAIADLHFAPTSLAREHLLKENISDKDIVVTGNTSIDFIPYAIKEGYSFNNKALEGLDKSKRLILMTAHRRENWGNPMEDIFTGVRRLADDFEDIQIIYPVHPNPIVRDSAEKMLSGHSRILLIEPLNVFDMLNLMKLSFMVLTDSGGIQEEAPALNKPVVVFREVTERPEGKTAGILELAGTDPNRIYEITKTILTDKAKYNKMANTPNPFGDGRASERIVKALLDRAGEKL